MMNDTLPADGGMKDADGPLRPSLRQRLRSETRERHERLDQRFEGMHLSDAADAYHRFVRMNAACHGAIEPVLSASPLVRAFPDWTTRDRFTHLSRDMSAMDLPTLRDPPLPAGLDRPDLAEAIGMAYVLEGSRLGGRYIYRLVKARSPEPGWATATFHYLESTDEPDRFRDFTMKADALLTRDSEIGRAVAAANACFDMFIEIERRLAEEISPAARNPEPSA